MKPIHFTKMHALGNDFVIINALNQSFDALDLPIINLGNRHMGIGFDQLLIIEASQQADFFCRIFNADGSEAEQCGNGLRCMARFIQEEGLCHQDHFSLETKAGVFPLLIKNYDTIRVTMGSPCIQEKLIQLQLMNDTVPISILSLGNPHAIVKVSSLDTIFPDQLGAKISMHTSFPQGVNVGFMQIINRNRLRLCTFERGVGLSYACGSNACAAVVAGIINDWLTNQVTVEFSYGALTIEWEGENQPVHMSGPAARVFSGEIFC